MGSHHSSHSEVRSTQEEERVQRRYDKLLAAVRSRKLTRVKSLCRKRGVSLPTMTDPSGNSCILMASQLGSKPMILYAIKQGCDVNRVNSTGSSALMLASALGHLEVVHTLLDNEADCSVINNNGNNSLLLASKGGHTSIVAKLLASGADINCRDSSGNSPLILACQHGHAETVRKLLQFAGGNNRAASSCKSDIVKFALEEEDNKSGGDRRDIDINVANESGETALIVACRDVRLELVHLLVSAGAAVNVADNRGKTALCYLLMELAAPAAGGMDRGEECQETINLLVQSAADLHLAMSIMDTDGQTD